MGGTGIPNCWEDGPPAVHSPTDSMPADWGEAWLRELQSLLAAGLLSAQEYEALWERAMAREET